MRLLPALEEGVDMKKMYLISKKERRLYKELQGKMILINEGLADIVKTINAGAYYEGNGDIVTAKLTALWNSVADTCRTIEETEKTAAGYIVGSRQYDESEKGIIYKQ